MHCLWIERVMWTVGITAYVSWAVVSAAGLTGAHQELRRFAEVQASGLAAGENPVPLAVLRIPKIKLNVAVLAGTAESTLNRAVGHIETTALPGSDGNSGLAGHRDRFFRGLKDIRAGDLLELETLTSVDTYRVERTWIVDPHEVSVLDPTDSPSITLVTCYPFYFVGSAPQRYIVRAVRTHRVPQGS